MLTQAQIFAILSGATAAPLILRLLRYAQLPADESTDFAECSFSGYAPGMLQLGEAAILVPGSSLLANGTADFFIATTAGQQSVAGHMLAVRDPGGIEYVISLAKYSSPAIMLPGAFTVSVSIYYQSYAGVM